MPIDQNLKDTITHYTDKMSDDEILDKMYNSPKQQDLRATIDHYRSAGESSAQILDRMMQHPVAAPAAAPATAPAAPVSAPTQSYLGGVAQAGGELAKKAMPWFFEDKNKPAAPAAFPEPKNASPQATPSPSVEEARPFGRPAKVGAPEPVLETPPSEATQWTMQNVINPLPEIATNAGVIGGGLAATVLGPGAIVGMPAAARAAATELQSPLTNLLLPKANMKPATAGEVAMSGLQGAKEGALQGIGMEATARPLEALANVLAPLKEGTGNLSKYLSRKSLRVPLSAETEGAISTVPEEGLNVVGGKAPAQIAERVNSLSRQVDNYIGKATAEGRQISREDMLAPARKLREVYAKSADTAEYGQKLENYIKEVENQVPEIVSPEQAQGIKKFVYDSINFDAKGANQLSQSAVQGKKAFGRGTRSELEGAAPEIGPLNARLSKLLEARPTVEQSAAKWSEAGPMKSASGHLKQAGARITGAAAKGLGKAEEAIRAPEGLPNTAFPNLSKLFMNNPEYEYNPLSNLETRGERMLPPPGTSMGGRATFGAKPQPTEQGMGMGRPALPPGTQYGPLPGEGAPKTRNRFGGTAAVPENLPERGFEPAKEMRVKELINKIAEGKGHEITAEDKLDLADALIKRIGIKVQGSTTTPKKNPLGFNFNERMKE